MRTGGSRKDRVFKVCVLMPDGVSEDDVMNYIEAAVKSHKGGFPLEHPMRQLDAPSVYVKRASPKYEEMGDK